MRIRFFNTFDPAAPFFRNLLPHLASVGYKVDVVISKAKYRIGDDFDKAVGDSTNIKVIRMMSGGVHIKGGWTKALAMILYSIHASAYSLFGPRADCNVFLTQPPIFTLWGSVLSIIRRQPYYYIEMDIFPEMLVELGMLRRSSFIKRGITWLYKLSLRRATGIIVIGRCMVEYMETMGIPGEIIHFVPNWADERLIRPVYHTDNHFRHSQNWGDKFVVMYAGNIGIPQDFDDILTVAEQMKTFERVVFVFVGGGAREADIRDHVEKHKLTNVIILPFLHDKYPLAEIISAGDLHFVTLRENVTGLAVPSKSYSILAAGRPILYHGSSHGEIARMVLEENIGVVISRGDVDEMKRHILKYINQPELCQTQGQKARELVEDGRYSRMQALTQYAILLKNNLQKTEKGITMP